MGDRPDAGSRGGRRLLLGVAIVGALVIPVLAFIAFVGMIVLSVMFVRGAPSRTPGDPSPQA